MQQPPINPPSSIKKHKKIREIVLDTETTGLDPYKGDRIVEIGCIELINHIPTGNVYHQYINPERDMPEEAEAVHGLSSSFLSDFPAFRDIYKEFVDFLEDSQLVIHNAKFDMKFINAELKWQGVQEIPYERAIDTLLIARKKFPGSPCSLDALCKRFNIDNSKREKHGALLDSELLAEVYLELLGGRQLALSLYDESPLDVDNINSLDGDNDIEIDDITPIIKMFQRKEPIEMRSEIGRPTKDEIMAHEEFMQKIRAN